MSAGTDTRREPGLAATIALYTIARLALVALIATVLALVGVPVLLAVLIALIVALPLSMVLFRGLRGRLDRALGVARERRGAQRAVLRAGLRGDETSTPPVHPAEPGPAGSSVAEPSAAGSSAAGSSAAGSSAAGASQAGAGASSDGEAQAEADRRQH